MEGHYIIWPKVNWSNAIQPTHNGNISLGEGWEKLTLSQDMRPADFQQIDALSMEKERLQIEQPDGSNGYRQR